MDYIEKTYLGLKDLLIHDGLSVQDQESFPIRVAFDQRKEQKPNKDAKTLGGIKPFAADNPGILKWTLSYSQASRKTAKHF